MYSIDDGTPFFFTFTNPINPSNPLGEPQLLLQTPRYDISKEHSILLQMDMPGSQNQTHVKIQSYIVQKSASSFALNITSVPVNEDPIILPPISSANPSQSRSSCTPFTWPKTVGAIVAGLVAALILFVARVLIRRRRRRVNPHPTTWNSNAFERPS